MKENQIVNQSSGRVNIDGTFYIRLEGANNLVLCQAKTVKDIESKSYGQQTENIVGYFNSLDGVFNRYFKEQVVMRSTGLNMELREFKKLLEEIRSEIKSFKSEFEI